MNQRCPICNPRICPDKQVEPCSDHHRVVKSMLTGAGLLICFADGRTSVYGPRTLNMLPAPPLKLP